jgi:serine/threonine protein kinase
MYEQCGTIAYVAPEVLQRRGYSYEVDVWSAGIIAHALLTSKLPWPECNDDLGILQKNVKEGNLDLQFLDEHMATEPHLVDLIKKMLLVDPKDRISVEDAIKHEVFKKKEVKATQNVYLQPPTGSRGLTPIRSDLPPK